MRWPANPRTFRGWLRWVRWRIDLIRHRVVVGRRVWLYGVEAKVLKELCQEEDVQRVTVWWDDSEKTWGCSLVTTEGQPIQGVDNCLGFALCKLYPEDNPRTEKVERETGLEPATLSLGS